MSDFGEAIIKRLNNPELQKTDNPMNRIINNTIGEWLQNFDDFEFFEQFFLQEASGKYLDLHGNDFGVMRKIDESDDDYRSRIIYESMGHLTVNFLREVYNVELYTKVNSYTSGTTLVSDNQYISSNGFYGEASTTVKNILNKKFVLGTGVTWL